MTCGSTAAWKPRPVNPRPASKRENAIRAPHVVVFNGPPFLFFELSKGVRSIFSVSWLGQGLGNREQKVTFRAGYVLRVGRSSGRWYRSGAGLVPKAGQFGT